MLRHIKYFNTCETVVLKRGEKRHRNIAQNNNG